MSILTVGFVYLVFCEAQASNKSTAKMQQERATIIKHDELEVLISLLGGCGCVFVP